MSRYGHKGSARKAALTVILNNSDTTITCDNLTGWPDGASGLRPFWVTINRGGLTEERVLCSSRSGNVLTIADGGRGEDDTTMSVHQVGEYIEHTFTSLEADQANAHIEAESGVHGVAGDVVGTTDAQSMTNKDISDSTLSDSQITDITATGTFQAEEVESDNIHDSTIVDSAIVNATSMTMAGDQDLTARVRPVVISDDAPSGGSNGWLWIRKSGTKSLSAKIAGTWQTILASMLGLPAGGTTGQYLTKASNSDGDAEWSTLPANTGGGVPDGGIENDILQKQSSTNGDVDWIAMIDAVVAAMGDGAPGQVWGLDGDGNPGWIDISGGGGGTPVDVIAQAPYPTGGTVTTYTDGTTGYSYRVHTFLYSGTPDNFSVTNGVIGSLLMLGGGGAGSNHKNGTFPIWGGGGGAGAMYEDVYAFGSGTHTMYVGGGGTATLDTVGGDGEDTLFEGYPALIKSGTYIARGGGGGGYSSNGRPGGSGGGGGSAWNGATAGGAATNGSSNGGVSADAAKFLGHNGSDSPLQGSAPGGGAFASGGTGVASSITGSSVTYAIGGAAESGSPSTTQNTGSGGGAGPNGVKGSDGANGVIIIRYRTS